jgi:ABC-type sugar transport system substrate-binding protein
MALGVIEAIKQLRLKPGQDILVGSIDWIPAALEAIQRGELAVSLGGHYWESAWSAILLYDYLRGHDFSGEALAFFSSMGLLTRKNIDQHLRHTRKGREQGWVSIDFKKWSKAYHPRHAPYQFDLNVEVTGP